ncbi:MAG: transposase [Acidobacteriota bacterium]|nr:transposase [Acidobacteriota bacterium]
MQSLKYLGLDVHRDTISAAVLDGDGKLIMQSILATHAAAILDFVRGLDGTVHVTFEEGTHSAWLHDLLVRHVARVVVCDPRQNALLKAGNKSDTIDARKLAELLRAGLLRPVYHGETSAAALKQLCRSYAALTEDTTRVKGRIKALYRSQAIPSAGEKPFGRRHRGEWLAQLNEAGMHRRAELLYEEMDALLLLRRQARCELIAESHKHDAVKLLRTVPFLGPIRAAVLIGRVQTPHRFRTKRQFWSYCGLALETRTSADYRFEQGQLVRAKKPVFIRGLNLNHNHDLKNLFKSAATAAGAMPGPFHSFYENLLIKGMQPAMARLTLARKIAAITLRVWKKGEPFDAEYVKPQAA